MILPRETLLKYVEISKGQGYRIITTNGCFDVIHYGHIVYLQQAKGYGALPDRNILVVLVNSDKSVRLNKGEKRPLVPEGERAAIVDALRFVDIVTFFDELTPIPLLSEIRPHVHMKGGDYTTDTMVETEAIRELGGQVAVGKFVAGKSTSGLIQLIVERYGGEMNE